MKDTVRLYKTFEKRIYQVDVELTDSEKMTLELLRTHRLFNELKYKDYSLIEIFNDERAQYLNGEANFNTNTIHLNHSLLKDFKSARKTYLHELTHIALFKYDWHGHDIVFFTVFGILLMRGNNMNEKTLNLLRYYDMQDATINQSVSIADDWYYQYSLGNEIEELEKRVLYFVYEYIKNLAKSAMTIDEIIEYILFKDNTLNKYIPNQNN